MGRPANNKNVETIQKNAGGGGRGDARRGPSNSARLIAPERVNRNKKGKKHKKILCTVLIKTRATVQSDYRTVHGVYYFMPYCFRIADGLICKQ